MTFAIFGRPGPWQAPMARWTGDAQRGGHNRVERPRDIADEHHMHHDADDRRHGRGRNRGRGGNRGPRPGFGPWGAGIPPVPPGPPMPPMPPMGPGGFHRGRKARRGDVRAAILALLSEDRLNGYQVIQEIAERSQGAWRPSPGAVYPAMQQLTDEGLIEPTGDGRRTRYRLTDAGREYVSAHPNEIHAPWEAMTPQFDDAVWELMELNQQTSTALMQVAQSAGPVGLGKAKKVMADTRRRLYQILADGEDDESGPAATDNTDDGGSDHPGPGRTDDKGQGRPEDPNR